MVWIALWGMIIFHTDANKKKKEREKGRETSWFAQNYHDGYQCPTVRQGNKGLKPCKGTQEWMWPLPRLLEGKMDFPPGCGAGEDGCTVMYRWAGEGLGCRNPLVQPSYLPQARPSWSHQWWWTHLVGFPQPGSEKILQTEGDEGKWKVPAPCSLHPESAPHPTSLSATFQATFKQNMLSSRGLVVLNYSINLLFMMKNHSNKRWKIILITFYPINILQPSS